MRGYFGRCLSLLLWRKLSSLDEVCLPFLSSHISEGGRGKREESQMFVANFHSHCSIGEVDRAQTLNLPERCH